MKFRITDLMDAVSDGSVRLEELSLASTENIKELTMKKIAENGIKRTPRHGAWRRIAPLAAAAALLLALGVTAYATGLFGWRVHPVEEGERITAPGRYEDQRTGEAVWREADLTGTTELILFDESDGPRYEAEFRPGWLPEEPDVWLPEQGTDFEYEKRGEHAAEGWYRFSSCDLRTEATAKAYHEAGIFGIPYQIEVISSYPAKRLMLYAQETRSLAEEDWDGVRVLKVETTTQSYSLNYVILVNDSEGWAVSVGGEDSIETLEHIARELEVRVTDTEVDFSKSEAGWSYFFVGRG